MSRNEVEAWWLVLAAALGHKVVLVHCDEAAAERTSRRVQEILAELDWPSPPER